MKKIGIKTIKNIIDQNSKEDTKLDFYGLDIDIKHQLSLNEMVGFVNSVVQACFNTETNEYMAEVKDFIIRSSIIEYYTNITLPSDMHDRYELIYALWDVLDIDTFIMNYIDTEQYYEIINAIDTKIDNIVDANIKEINALLSNAINTFVKLSSKFEDLFSGVSKDDMTSLVNALVKNGGVVDETKIVDALLDHRDKSNGKSIVS